MHLEFVGAAKTVTGSMHLVRVGKSTLLLDCGLFQGQRRESFERNRQLPLPIDEIDAVVLSHAHIDHSGALPMLVKLGYRGPIYATPATRDLCAVMLRDAAAIQESDARFLNKQAEKEGLDVPRVEPLYSDDDVIMAMERFISIPYHMRIPIADGARLTFHDAGHVLGSALSALDLEEGGATRRLIYTGDLGRRNKPILRDPEEVGPADVLLTESTYGDRLHDPYETMEEHLARVILRTRERGGKLLIPSFALERAQEVLLALKGLRRAGKIPRIRTYVDSPLAVQITEVFKLHPECYDPETRALLQGPGSPFDFEDLRYVMSTEDSKAVTAEGEPSIIIAASGMCEGGRILHHLKSCIEDPRHTILIVGYQAQHTLGRRLVEGRPRVKIFGVERERRAEVVILNGFSAHADQKDLVQFARSCGAGQGLRQVALVHGDPRPQEILADLLYAVGQKEIALPGPGDRLELL